MSKSLGLFDTLRTPMDRSIELTVESLNTYGQAHPHWVIAWSGGKDSTALLTLTIYLIESGQVAPPKRLTVCYADTRLELTPLYVAAQDTIRALQARDYEVRTVIASMDKRFLVYVLGRGVPPPNNNTLRWCTRQIKVDPMAAEIRSLIAESGDVLMLTGVRVGESAVRDARIAVSCGRNGSECGQGWYQQMSGDRLATLAPILHWRVCHVWDWLMIYAPAPDYGGWNTQDLAAAYGGDEAAEINARTGCVGCPLANKETALDAVLRDPRWAYLAPLKELRPLWRELREPRNRLRKVGEVLADGMTPSSSPYRMGPLTLECREWALERVLDIQARVNAGAGAAGRPEVYLLQPDELARIRELIAANTWPQRWDGSEPIADTVTQPGEDDYQTMLPGLGQVLALSNAPAPIEAKP